jgi:hypothetical protein
MAQSHDTTDRPVRLAEDNEQTPSPDAAIPRSHSPSSTYTHLLRASSPISESPPIAASMLRVNEPGGTAPLLENLCGQDQNNRKDVHDDRDRRILGMTPILSRIYCLHVYIGVSDQPPAQQRNATSPASDINESTPDGHNIHTLVDIDMPNNTITVIRDAVCISLRRLKGGARY